MKEAAVQRLIQYFRCTERGHANARFLHLDMKELTGEEKGKVEKTAALWDLAVQARLRDIVEQLENALEKQSVDMTVLKPNHFATLSVYFAKLATFEVEKPRDGLARYCQGSKEYVLGSSVKSREHLASQRLRHCHDSGAPQFEVLEQAGQAIAAAPVVRELCHMGFAGHDKLVQHCHTNARRPSRIQKASVSHSRGSRALLAAALEQAQHGTGLSIPSQALSAKLCQ